MDLILRRKIKTPFSVVGELEGVGAHIFTLEDKWRNNETGVSCIPAGVYNCIPHGWEANSKVKFPRVWEVTKVPDRTAILIHVGNTHLDTRGCILVGFDLNIVGGEAKILNSRSAVEYLQKKIGNNKFKLTIVDA